VSDPNENPNPPAEGTAPTSTPASAPAESYSADDVARTLAADREERGAAAAPEASDPIARFRASTHGSKLYGAKPGATKQAAQPQGGGELSELVQIAKATLAMNLAAMKPPAPPPPPKPMTAREKLASSDATIWLKRGNVNEWTQADRDALVQEHEAELRKSGFRGHIEHEANSRAARDIAAAGSRALQNIKIYPDHMLHLAGRK
jgi:hypothetical protein